MALVTEPASNGFLWRVGSLERRVDKLEELEPAVMAERVNALSKEVQALKKAFYTFAASVAGSAVLFAFTVFGLLGHHP